MSNKSIKFKTVVGKDGKRYLLGYFPDGLSGIRYNLHPKLIGELREIRKSRNEEKKEEKNYELTLSEGKSKFLKELDKYLFNPKLKEVRGSVALAKGVAKEYDSFFEKYLKKHPEKEKI